MAGRVSRFHVRSPSPSKTASSARTVLSFHADGGDRLRRVRSYTLNGSTLTMRLDPRAQGTLGVLLLDADEPTVPRVRASDPTGSDSSRRGGARGYDQVGEASSGERNASSSDLSHQEQEAVGVAIRFLAKRFAPITSASLR